MRTYEIQTGEDKPDMVQADALLMDQGHLAFLRYVHGDKQHGHIWTMYAPGMWITVKVAVDEGERAN